MYGSGDKLSTQYRLYCKDQSNYGADFDSKNKVQQQFASLVLQNTPAAENMLTQQISNA